MSPERRFGQIEEVLAEALTKIDRIEDLATKTFGLAETANTNGETTAIAVAKSTVENQRNFDRVFSELSDIKLIQQKFLTNLVKMDGDFDHLETIFIRLAKFSHPLL